ncbi:uncharacterized protein ccdc142 isoform X2 [Larimichthys crocea]|uniref:uncharacterized protein ccdc142 isoform X2 n=1 Tax=Larimichthys crocea TaxID=215358 RepID=UPI000901E1E8|nr:coiled-coil domain-containing protein 142 isoform X2 [Larimichthys crocea]
MHCDSSESLIPEKEQLRCRSCSVTEDLPTDGPSSQRSISRSLQRAEVLLRSTFNPSLKWLFHGRSEDEEEEEQNFVVAHNLASRSSARLLRLQQALLTVAPQWQLVGGAQMGSPQVSVKCLPAEGGVLLLPSSSSLQKNYRALWRLLEQRSLLIFIHEYTRRARIAAAYISRVRHLLEKSRLTLNQAPSNWSSLRVGLGSLSQELRIHLNHWSCLFSKVQSDQYLRPALVRHTKLLVEIKQTLDLLGLQALVLMESYVYVVLSAVARTKLESVPREVLEDVLAGTDLYNQAVWERAQHSSTQLRTTVLQLAHYSTLDCSLTNRRGHCIAAFSVKELMMILALHHADRAAKQLHCWASDLSCHCQVHTNHKAFTCSDSSQAGTATLRSEWTWDQLQHTYLMYSPLFSTNHLLPLQSSSGTESSNQDQSSLCQTCISHTGLVQSSVEPLVSVQPNLERQTSVENCKLLQTLSPPLSTFQHLSAQPLSGVCQQAFLSSSVELLFQLLVSSSDLLAPHTPKPVAPTEQLLTDVSSPNGKRDTMTSPVTIINTAGSVELNRLSTEQNKEQHVEGTQQEWREVEATASSGCQRDGDPEREETVRAEQTAVQPDCHHWPHSVQWLDLGQSLVYADLFGQYRTLLWTLCSKALWLQLHVPQAGNSAGSINLQDSHTRFQILHRISQASNTDLVPKESRTMLEDFSLCLFTITAHAQWDQVLCRSLGSALKDKCLTDINQRRGVMTRGVMSVTMEHFVLLSSLCCLHSDSRASGSCSPFSSRLALQRNTVSLALATVQLSAMWVMSKSHEFLSSWSLQKFLLITQGDLKVLTESLEELLHQTKSLMMNSDSDHHSTLHNHNQVLLRQQLKSLEGAVSKLQTFSALMLKTFSSDCKRMSGEIFEQTMPSGVHWRPSLRTSFPTSPSEYASLAAQTVIGQVLEGVAPLSDDARVQALSITMTAFMEAWMEHILKHRIKFSVQGALQLKQDFDSIKELIQSDKYGLSAELHQRLLSLRVFQQVDSAVVCLLQQPQAKPYLHSRRWESFTHCCPANRSRDSIDAVVGNSITNLRCMEGEDLTPSHPSVVTTDLSPVDQSNPREPYLAPSLALGSAQQDWLDLRIHSSTRRWRLPGLQCLSKSEP